MRLILASTSPYRKMLMTRLGLPFLAFDPRYEESLPDGPIDPSRLVVSHALGKALSLLSDHPDSLIVGSDQVVACDGEIFTKPGSAERAVEQILRLAGREHQLHTAVAVIRSPPGDDAADQDAPGETALVINHLKMRELSRKEAEVYVAAERPIDCAGAYKSEGLGITLFEFLRGDDPTAVIGLPLIALLRLLRRFGVDPLQEQVGRTDDPAGGART